MATLFNILDGINSDSEYADENLSDVNQIISYAEACGKEITEEQAIRIQAVGQKWREDQKNGNGEWSRMRHEAADSLNES